MGAGHLKWGGRNSIIVLVFFVTTDLPQRRQEEVKAHTLHNILVARIHPDPGVVLHQLRQAMVLPRQVGVLLRQP